MAVELDGRLQANDVNDEHMNVLITGGKENDRAVLQDVIFNALEGAGFRNLAFMPTSAGDMPSTEVKSMLDAIQEENPDFFNMQISIESARRAGEERGAPPEAWERALKVPHGGVEMIVDGKITMRF